MPDAELQPVHYARPAIFDLTQRFVRRSAIAAAEAEAALGLRTWTVACLCRSLSLDNILTFITGTVSSPCATSCMYPQSTSPYWCS